MACSHTRLFASSQSFADVADRAQQKIVKIFGAGGLHGLEAYQSGFLISSDGHILTAWSYVLDPDYTTVVLDDGRKFQAEFVGSDPRLEIAVLKIDAHDLDHFELSATVSLNGGARVLAFSNLFGVATGDEAASVQHGVVSSVTALSARRGAFETTYRGPVYVLDAMTNNAGAAGGALTDRHGILAGVLGKELRNSLDNTWLNYAVPISEVTSSVNGILAGKTQLRADDETLKTPTEPLTLARLGLVLVPDVLHRTPPYVDRIVPDSAAEKAGLRPDDMVVFIGQRMVQTCKEVVAELSLADRDDPAVLTVLRGRELIEAVLRPLP
jgi:serine protease Do